MTFLYNFYDSSTNYCQAFLDSRIPEVSKDFVKSSTKSFIGSFSFSVILMGGNPMAGLVAGSVAIVASTIHAMYMTLVRNLRGHQKSPQSNLNDRYFANLLAVGSILSFATSIGLDVTYKTSFILATIFYFRGD